MRPQHVGYEHRPGAAGLALPLDSLPGDEAGDELVAARRSGGVAGGMGEKRRRTKS